MGKTIVKMYLFKKIHVVKEGENKGAKIPNYFLKFPNSNVNVSANITNAVRDKLLKSGMDFPYLIELQFNKDNKEECDYFMGSDSFTNAYGEPQVKDVCVIQDFRSVEHYNITGMSLEDYFAKHNAD